MSIWRGDSDGLSKEVPRRELSERQIWELLQAEAENRRTAIREYERLGRQQEAEQLHAEVALFMHYLEDPSAA
jgi:uncharacterized protein YqeY